MRLNYPNFLFLGLAAFSALQSPPVDARALQRRADGVLVAREPILDISARGLLNLRPRPKPKVPSDKTPDTPKTDNNGKPTTPTTGDTTNPVDSNGDIIRIGAPTKPDNKTPTPSDKKPDDKTPVPGDKKPDDKTPDSKPGTVPARKDLLDDTPNPPFCKVKKVKRGKDKSCYTIDDYAKDGDDAISYYQQRIKEPDVQRPYNDEYYGVRPDPASRFDPDFDQQLHNGLPGGPTPGLPSFSEPLPGRSVVSRGRDGGTTYTGRVDSRNGYLFTEATYSNVDKTPPGDHRLYSSDHQFNMWKDYAGDKTPSLNGIIHKDIANDGTRRVIEDIYEKAYPGRLVEDRPILRVHSGTPEFKALAGTDNVKPTIRMLGDHHQALEDKFISSIDLYPQRYPQFADEIPPIYSMAMHLSKPGSS